MTPISAHTHFTPHHCCEEQPSYSFSKTLTCVAAIALTILTLGIALTFQWVRDALSYSEEAAPLPHESIDIELDSPRHGEWRAGPGADEQEQTLEHFCEFEDLSIPFYQKKLKIIPLGGASELEMRCYRIVVDYLRICHGMEVELEPSVGIEELAIQMGYAHLPIKRNLGTHDQYNIGYLLPMLRRITMKADTAILALTSQDIYSEGMNFIYGYGDEASGTGIVSARRIATPTSDLPRYLRHMMQTAFHEFGHMRKIAHCTKYKCIMQGANGPGEAAKTPLTLCTKDMGKIAHLNNWTFQEGVQKHLAFFENFFQNYGIALDFSREIDTLKRQLRA